MPIQIGLEGIQRAVAASAAPGEQLRLALSFYIEGITDHLGGSVVRLEEGMLSPAHRRQVIAGVFSRFLVRGLTRWPDDAPIEPAV